jgi:hypothetical protein
MFQLARRVAHSSAANQTHEVAAAAAGKRTQAETAHGPALGEPDYYNAAIDSAMRELDALRATALPAYVAIRKRTDLAPLKKQIELVRAALQVRHLIAACNKHIYALEFAQWFADPMVRFLRARLDVAVLRAVKLGVYDDARELLPERYVEPKQPQSGTSARRVRIKRHEPPPVTDSVFAKPAQLTRAPPKSAATTASPRVRLPRSAASLPVRVTVRP